MTDEPEIETNEWKHGLPPNADVTEWEVYFSPGGIIWHRRIVVEAPSYD